MNTYAVKYLDGINMKVAHVQGGNQTEAGGKFSKIHPNIEPDKIISVVNINEQETDYGMAIGMAKFLAFIGWIGVLIGAIIVISALIPILKSGQIGLEVLALGPSLSVFVIGLVLVVMGQTSRAVLDNANYSKQMLNEMQNK